MGFYHVNLENFNSASVIPRAIWALVITFSFFLIWLDYPETMNKAKKYSLMGAGVVLLIVMAIFYKGGHDEPHGMRPSWWGILGIIGWSYLVCALLFFVAKGKLNLLILFWVFLAGVNIAVHLTLLPKGGLWIIKDASSTTLVMGGIVISGIYSMLVQQGKTQRLWYILAALGIALIAVGFLIRPYAQGISKIRSTPAWVFICSGITILVFEMLVYAVDFKGKKDWFKIIAPAGTSTLTCYLMPYFQVYLMELFMINYPSVLNNGLPGLMRSFATGLILIAIVGLMEKKRLRLKI
jgi:hypothetical protein